MGKITDTQIDYDIPDRTIPVSKLDELFYEKSTNSLFYRQPNGIALGIQMTTSTSTSTTTTSTSTTTT